jgi:hypothetical protein
MLTKFLYSVQVLQVQRKTLQFQFIWWYFRSPIWFDGTSGHQSGLVVFSDHQPGRPCPCAMFSSMFAVRHQRQNTPQPNGREKGRSGFTEVKQMRDLVQNFRDQAEPGFVKWYFANHSSILLCVKILASCSCNGIEGLLARRGLLPRHLG